MKQMYDEYYKRCSCDKCSKCTPTQTPNIPKPMGAMYAQAYVPDQTDTQLFNPTMSLESGTAFAALNMPYQKGKNLKFFGKEAV